MSRDAFYTALATMVSDPEAVRRLRAGDQQGLAPLNLEPLDRDRLLVMAADPRMSVLCSLYRSNRLTALVRTVPTLVDALGDDLRSILDAYWAQNPRPDMQFASEAREFCSFVDSRAVGDVGLQEIVRRARDTLDARYPTAPI